MDIVLPTGEIYPLGRPFVGCICIGIAIKNLQMSEAYNKRYLWIVLCICSVVCTYYLRGGICAAELIIVTPIIWLCVYGKLKILENKVLLFVGMVSYPLYLIHQNISFIIQNQLTKILGYYSVIWAFIAFAVVVVMGIMLYFFVERPIQYKIGKFKNENGKIVN